MCCLFKVTPELLLCVDVSVFSSLSSPELYHFNRPNGVYIVQSNLAFGFPFILAVHWASIYFITYPFFRLESSEFYFWYFLLLDVLCICILLFPYSGLIYLLNYRCEVSFIMTSFLSFKAAWTAQSRFIYCTRQT